MAVLYNDQARIALKEGYLGLSGGDYTDPHILDTSLQALNQIPAEQTDFVGGALFVISLSNANRLAEAEAFLVRWLALRGTIDDVAQVHKCFHC